MPDHQVKRALISVYDKTGVVEFAQALVTEFGVEIISTGGTATLLKQNGIPVRFVEDLTGFPEMLDGRVKTLNPRIHAAILADRDKPEHVRRLKEQGIEPIDMVVVNLYPFERTIAEPDCSFERAVEMIDIGGPCLLRAAAKNHRHVWVVSAPEMYPRVLALFRGERWDEARSGRELRAQLACDSFECTTRYDAAISGWLSSVASPSIVEVLNRLTQLRYGENPHQHAETVQRKDDHQRPSLLLAGAVDTAEPMSFNNYLDGHAALELCAELTRELRTSAVVFVKHTNPCGVGIGADPLEAYRSAYLGDPNAAMGGILACNFAVDGAFATAVMDTYATWGKQAGAGGFFVEVWIAPKFSSDAVERIRTAKSWGSRVRVLSVGDMNETSEAPAREYRSITGGMLIQTRDLLGLDEDHWKVVTKRAPADSEMSDLSLAWLIAKHTKSNAVSICNNGMLIGNGAGQMSRVMSSRIATWLAKDNGHGDRLAGAAAASDGFFPFADGPQILMDAGITAIIQPGGSKRDAETIAACDARNVAMVLSGTRHFKH